MEFGLLADQPNVLRRIARWYFDEWTHKVPGETLASTEATLTAYLNRDRIPLIVLAAEEKVVVGAAQLKFREMDIYPEKEHWLGGVFVSPEHRGRRIGSNLIETTVEVARSLKVERLHLQTERLDGGLYAELGWNASGDVHYKGRHVLVMERILVA